MGNAPPAQSFHTPARHRCLSFGASLVLQGLILATFHTQTMCTCALMPLV